MPKTEPVNSGRLTIGMLSRSLTEVHQTQWLGAVDTCRALDVNLVTFVASDLDSPRDDAAAANRVFDLVSARRIDGLLVWSLGLEVHLGAGRFASFLRRFEHLPITLIEQGLPGHSSVMMDDRGGMASAVDHLIDVHGHRRIGFIRGPLTHAGAERRLSGYTDSLARHGIPFDPTLVSAPALRWSRTEAACATEALLDQTDRLDAIVAAADGLAVGALNALNRRGVQPPEDIALVGFDDDANVLQAAVSLKEPRSAELDEAVRLSATMLPLATVRAPFYLLGQRAAELMVARLRGESVAAAECLPTEFIPRLSCGCAAPPAEAAPAHTGSPVEIDTGRAADAPTLEATSAATRDADDESLAILTTALLADIERDEHEFERLLTHLVRANVRAGESLDDWWQRLVALQRLVDDRSFNLEGEARATLALRSGQRFLLEMAERFSRYGSLVTEKRHQLVRGIGQRLVTRVELSELADDLTEELPRLGIESAVVAVCEGGTEPAEPEPAVNKDTCRDGSTRSFLVVRDSIRLGDQEGRAFPSQELVPGPLDDPDMASSLVVFSLQFNEDVLGHVVLSVGPRLGWVYAALVQQLESALYNALLVGRLKAEIGRRERAEIALTAVNDELEQHVAERTAELQRTNEALISEIAERARAEELRANLESRLHVAQKMDSLGRLAGGVAHDFNNLLVVINGYSQMVLDGLEAGDPTRADVEQIRIAGERAAGLTRQLLAFGRRQPNQPIVLDLNEVIGQVEPMLRRLIAEDVAIETTLGAAPPFVTVDRGQIEQVIVNLAVNARDSMPAGGRLSIETTNVVLSDAHLGARPGRYVKLAISDTGSGMDDEVRAHLFEPFFTTKQLGAGTGLGLSTVFGIVRGSDGLIEVASEPGRGSTFNVYLPQREAPVESPTETPRPLVAQDRRTETILVVEDEPAVRAVTERFLRLQGYDVHTVSGGQEALAFLREFPRQIDLLLTDVVMPGMNGRQLVELARQMQPSLAAMYLTGYDDGAHARQGLTDTGAVLLEKPVSPEALAQTVRQVLLAADGDRPSSDRPPIIRPHGS
jgi:signal transduction histidine kinase/DNA-binding LacI/PurR family transcriptional regulator/ActR/RegA family two-component response regulator